MKTKLIVCSMLCSALLMASPNDDAKSDRTLKYVDINTSASLIMDNKYIKVGVSQDGTFGIGGNINPGMLYDKNGTGNYNLDYDYLTPGSPFEYWVVQYDGNETDYTSYGSRDGESYYYYLIGQNNQSYQSQNSDYVKDSNVTALATTRDGNITSVMHKANIDDKLLLEQVYSINPGTQYISVVAKLTNTSDVDITGLKFARGLDPDPDVGEFGDYNTVNQRGFTLLDSNGSEKTIAKEDIAFTVGASSGAPVGIYTLSDLPHTTMINNSWSQEPDVILAAEEDSNTGDYVISVAFDFGDTLEAGKSIEFRYGYMFGTDMNTSIAEVIEEVEHEELKYDFYGDLKDLPAGWYMVGLDSGIPDMRVFNDESIDVVWAYSNKDGWSVYTNKYTLDPSQRVIPFIRPREGFWIKKLY